MGSISTVYGVKQWMAKYVVWHGHQLELEAVFFGFGFILPNIRMRHYDISNKKT